MNQKQIHTTEGPASIVFTTTSNPQSLNDEFVNRLSIVFVDDGSDMTRQVIDAQARSAASLPDSNKLRRARVEIAAFHLYHASLEPLKVVIPFAEKIKITSVDNPTSRRLNQLVYSYIKVLALLHQKTRIRGLHHGIEYITATKCDYEIAYELMVANAPNVLELVPNAARSRFQILSSRFKDELDDPIWFTSSDVQLALKLSKEQTNRDLRALVSAGCLKKNDARQPSYKVASDLPPTADIGLVHPSQVETHRVIPDAFICDPLYVNATQRLEASGHEVTEKAQAKIVEIEID